MKKKIAARAVRRAGLDPHQASYQPRKVVSMPVIKDGKVVTPGRLGPLMLDPRSGRAFKQREYGARYVIPERLPQPVSLNVAADHEAHAKHNGTKRFTGIAKVKRAARARRSYLKAKKFGRA